MEMHPVVPIFFLFTPLIDHTFLKGPFKVLSFSNLTMIRYGH